MNQHLSRLLPAVLLLCVGCPRTPVEVGALDPSDAGPTASAVVTQTDFTVLVEPTRELDISAVGCISQSLADSDPDREGVQVDCQALDMIPCDQSGANGCLPSGYQETPLLQCKDAAGLPLNPDSPQPETIPQGNRPCWTFSRDASKSGCPGTGQRISVLRPSDSTSPPGTMVAMKCRTQPSAAPDSQPTTTTKKKLGASCDVGASYTGDQAVFNSATSECASGLCLKPMNVSGVSVDTNPYCSATCSTDSDCDGAERDANDPNDKTCRGGYACGVEFVTGSICCKKVCICKDFLSAKGVMVPLTCDPVVNNGTTACNSGSTP